tara:strand:- start:513 stop:692 length:180 start_codon:yes stop_codon:yes gene_type:complete
MTSRAIAALARDVEARAAQINANASAISALEAEVRAPPKGIAVVGRLRAWLLAACRGRT